MRLEHAGGAATTILTGPINSTDMAFTVDDATGHPDGSVGPFWEVLDPGTPSEEKVLCVSRSGNTFTVNAGGRGGDDTVAVSHATNAEVRHVFTAEEADAANAHIEADSGVHGVSGAVVGRTSVMTLTGKTISGLVNTFQSIAQSSIVDLLNDLNAFDGRLDVLENYPFLVKGGSDNGDKVLASGQEAFGCTYNTEESRGNWSFAGQATPQFEIPSTGLYMVTAQVAFSCPTNTSGSLSFRLRTGVLANDPDTGDLRVNDSWVIVNGQSGGTLHIARLRRFVNGAKGHFSISNGTNQNVTIHNGPTRTMFDLHKIPGT